MKRKYQYKFVLFLIATLLITQSLFSRPQKALAAASLYLSPSSTSVAVGGTVTVNAMVDTGGTSINAAEGNVSISGSGLECQSVSTSGSIFSFWTSGPSGCGETITFGGGLANPGYNGSGKILTITFKATGEGTINFSISGSRILANDGLGTNIYGGGGSASVSVVSAGSTSSTGSAGSTGSTGSASSGGVRASSQMTTVNSVTHPDQNAWYTSKKLDLSWSASAPVGYSFGLDQSASTAPSASPVSAKSKSYDIAGEGIWYFHVRAKFDSGFGPTSHYKIQIDTSPPEEFSITINQEGGTSNPTPIINFVATDKLSGIAKYEAVIDSGQPFAINGGDKLPKQKPGDHKIIIRAVDKAGNVRESNGNYHIKGIAPPDVRNWTKTIGLLEGVTFSGFADPEDTIIIYLGDEEVARFKAKDHKVSVANSLFSLGGRSFASSGDKVAWEYSVKKPLSPGVHYFRIGLIDKNGAESELSEPIKVSVVASTTKLFGRSFPTFSYIILPLIVLIFVLVSIIIWLLKKLRKFAKNKGLGFGSAWPRVKRIFSKTEKEIDHQIEEIVPSSNLSKGVVGEVKKDLKEKVHETFEKEQRNLDKNEDPEDKMHKVKVKDGD